MLELFIYLPNGTLFFCILRRGHWRDFSGTGISSERVPDWSAERQLFAGWLQFVYYQVLPDWSNAVQKEVSTPGSARWSLHAVLCPSLADQTGTEFCRIPLEDLFFTDGNRQIDLFRTPLVCTNNRVTWGPFLKRPDNLHCIRHVKPFFNDLYLKNKAMYRH